MSHVVVITGGTAGIGRATARAFAHEGAAIAVLARGEERLAAAMHELHQAGAAAIGLPVDVADARQVDNAASRVERELGPIDVWVNNAMVTVFASFDRLTPDEYRRVTDVTYLGTVNGTRAALARMRPRNRGCIVQVGSALAYQSIPLQSAYCGAKSAVRAFTDAVRAELIHEGSDVRITMIQLSAFNTPQFDWARNRMPKQPQPLPPIFQPEIAADAIVRASRASRREWWIGWPAVRAILSARIVPELANRLSARLAYEGQMTARAVEPGAPDNLMQPVRGDQAAHGRFDERARSRTMQPWLSKNRRGIAVAAALIAIIIGVVVLSME
jgi:NADP-dependent 3-hydroxy acid dehydrogenase YdfG